MKKLLTLALALVAVAAFTGLSVGQDKQRVMTGKVLSLNATDKTFAVEVTFSVAKLQGPLPKVGETIDITYIAEAPGELEAVTVRARVRGAFAETRKAIDVADDKDSPKVITGKVTQVNARNKTFVVQVTFSAAKLSKLPTVGQVVDITYTEPPGGGPLEASNLNLSKSNIN